VALAAEAKSNNDVAQNKSTSFIEFLSSHRSRVLPHPLHGGDYQPQAGEYSRRDDNEPDDDADNGKDAAEELSEITPNALSNLIERNPTSSLLKSRPCDDEN
jgi:hypothetical protein